MRESFNCQGGLSLTGLGVVDSRVLLWTDDSWLNFFRSTKSVSTFILIHSRVKNVAFDPESIYLSV